MKSGTFLGLALGMVTGACLVKYGPKVQSMMDEAKDSVKEKVVTQMEQSPESEQQGM